MSSESETDTDEGKELVLDDESDDVEESSSDDDDNGEHEPRTSTPIAASIIPQSSSFDEVDIGSYVLVQYLDGEEYPG